MKRACSRNLPAFLLLSSIPALCFNLSCQAAPASKTGDGTTAAIIEPGDRSASRSASTFALSKDGKALVPIVLSGSASDEVKGTAEYLAARLHKITGAKFEIVSGDGASGLVLGTWQQFPVAALKKPLEIRPAIVGANISNGREAFAIRTEAKRVLLLGGDDFGVSHAAARFLELLGYRQFYPGDEWEVVPALPTLQFNVNEVNRPSILSRKIWHAFGMPSDIFSNETRKWPDAKYSEQARQDIADWYRQNRLGEGFHIFNAHNYASIAEGANKPEFEAHPEYYGLIDGKRVPGTICDSNPEVRRLAGVAAVDYLKNNPALDMYSLEPHDGDAMCQCENCRAVGNYSERAFALANVAARELAKALPGKMIGILAYFKHDVPPSFDLEPNIHVQVARLFLQGPYPFQELVRLWSQKTKNIGVYEYFSTYVHGQDRLRPRFAAGPTADLAGLTRNIRELASNNLLSLHSESSIAWGAHGRGNYIATRLMWNPQADVNATLHDFYSKAFGPAAPAMKRYFERVDGGNEVLSNTLLGLAMRDVQEASTLAKDRPDVLARLSHIKQFLYYNYLQHRMLNAKDKAERKPFVFELLRHEYRTRNTYMTHWAGTTYHVPGYAQEYEEPSWDFMSYAEVIKAMHQDGPIRLPAWYEARNYTAEETERNFQVALAFFQPQKLLPTAEYSYDLVPIDWGAPNASPEFQVACFRSGSVYLFSVRGEPIEVDLAGEKVPFPVFYTLEDSDGKTVASGSVPADNEKHRVSLKVPGAGLYQLKPNARAWWLYSVEAGTPHTLELSYAQDISGYTYKGSEGRNFFYVPRGTNEIQFFWGGDAHTVFDADGRPIAEVPAMSDYLTIAVPPGHDGKVWSFSGRYQPRQFVNIPIYFSPWKDGLMVPRELAKKDGLKIRQP